MFNQVNASLRGVPTLAPHCMRCSAGEARRSNLLIDAEIATPPAAARNDVRQGELSCH